MNQKQYDVVVIGGGLAGVQAAMEAAKNDLKTAIIEENQIGGSLYKTSDRPLELLIENNRFLEKMYNSKKNGLVFSDVSFNPDLFFDEIDKEADDLSEDLVNQLKDENVDIYLGHGLVRPDKTINIIREGANTRIIGWDNLIYAGEPVSSIPPIIRSKASGYYTGRDIGLLDYIPKGLIIYGNGPKAIKVADIWSSLGGKVYIISPSARILESIPEEIEENILSTLKNQNVEIYNDVDILDLYQDSEHDYHFELVDNQTNEENRIIGQELVVLTNEGTSLIGIEALDLDQENGWIKTDDHLQTNINGLYTWTGSNKFNRNSKTDKQAARYLAEVIAGKTDENLDIQDNTFILDFHPTYAQYGIVEESDSIKKGTYQDGDEFLNLYIDEFGEIVGAQSFHQSAKELIQQLDFLSQLEISMEDLVDMETTGDLNGIIIQAAKDAAKHEKNG